MIATAAELGLALDKGEVDAVADSEPIGSLLLAEGKVRNVADQAADPEPEALYRDVYADNGERGKDNGERGTENGERSTGDGDGGGVR